MTGAQPVPKSINFPEEERQILKRWRDESTFEESLKQSKDRPPFTCYDGPPFATGLPHYGHILGGTIKDVVTRWAHMSGHYVERRFGWDAHGLPVEYLADKELDVKGPKDVHEMGIANYNAKCRSIVMRYAKEWRETVERMGRWIDFDNDYKTLYPSFMESVWWVFAQLYKKDLVYREVKVMPYSTGCSTPLSNFEAGQNYKDVEDPAVFVGFQLVSNPNRYLVAWTTTPWTLPSNLALCVHPDLDYVAFKDNINGKEYVLLESRVPELYKGALEINIKVLKKFKGSALKGLDYVPLFPYFAHLKEHQGREKVFTVLNANFITTDQGTGVIHQAPYFDEVDFQVCLENGVILEESPMICPVDEKGLFTSEVVDLQGIYVKEADKSIILALKEKGNLVKTEQVTHSYPFCWRSDTPLLYKAVPSWFIRVESMVEKLLANNEKTNWVPNWARDKLFGTWLRGARDWAVSRNRFWGTPINLWTSEDYQEIVCPESIEELVHLTGADKITDLHRESIDHLTIPSHRGKGQLRRVSDVFDCWFESGSMPYAQQHYPFENRDTFDASFPADFIAGIDQTRGWFYTLLVLSTALFDRPPFKNLVCNGLVLGADGKKMSKGKAGKNPNPMTIVDAYGADALRLYLINSSVVRGENLRFREEGVKDVLKDVLLPWFNAYRFFMQGVHLYEQEVKQKFTLREAASDNIMDKWILSFTNSLIASVHQEMSAYHLYAVVSLLTKYLETLTNCYIRLNRKRFKDVSPTGIEDRQMALSTLGHALVLITRLMSPFTPFFCEYLWDNMKSLVGQTERSVHFTLLPKPHDELIDKTVERRVATMRTVIDLGRMLRERKNIPLKYPLKEMVVINRSAQFLDDLNSLASYVLLELNVEKLTTSEDPHKYGVRLKAEPNFRLLGARLKADQKKVSDYLKNEITQEELEQFLELGKLTICGYELSTEEVGVSFTVNPTKERASGEAWETEAGNACVVMLNTVVEGELLSKGLAREVVHRVQRLKKDAKLIQTQAATVYCSVTPSDSALATAIKTHVEWIQQATTTPVKMEPVPEGVQVSYETDAQIKDATVKLRLVLPNESTS